jgi:hypothetical protein
MLDTSSATHEPIYESLQSEQQQHYDGDQEYPYYYDQQYEEQYQGYYPTNGYDDLLAEESYTHQYPLPAHNQIYVPLPEFQAEENLSEKDRIRRAEERLLPSQPPQEIGGPLSSRTLLAPSAPPALDDHHEDLYGAGDLTPSRTEETAHLQAEHNDHASSSSNPPVAPSAPSSGEFAPNIEARSSEDKQELERQRLLAEASAPSDFLGDEDNNGSEGSSGAQHEPSAPILTEEDEYGGNYAHHAGPSSSAVHESLPRYER